MNKKISEQVTSDKKKALQVVFSQIEDKFGKGSIMRLGSRPKLDVNVIQTGSLGLDIALGVGGYPKGRIIEIFGPESSGKTTLALHAVANAQKAGGVAAFVDAEHALDAIYAQQLGVDIDNLLVSQPDNGEDALEITEYLVRSNAVDIIIVDSVAALVPKAEIQGLMGDSHVGLQARLMSQALRKLTGAIGKSNTCVIFINQIRLKIGVTYGNPETTTGGNALKFYASVRLEIRRGEVLKEGDVSVAARTKVKVVKNKVAPPFKIAEFDVVFGKGISKLGELVDIGVNTKVLQRQGSWYSFGEQRLGQGRERAILALKESPELYKKVEDSVLAKAELLSISSLDKPNDESGEEVK
ncbi:MAG: recombinase RecA [Candidatus Coatesbacteria bacterium]|nr:recombinase RecA [Candidatus Coatesbacteria bacterium]